jgi:hypothetical protein
MFGSKHKHSGGAIIYLACMNRRRKVEEEKVKLSEGLVRKIHALRTEIEDNLLDMKVSSLSEASYRHLSDRAMHLASQYSERFLYEDLSTSELLEAYESAREEMYGCLRQAMTICR